MKYIVICKTYIVLFFKVYWLCRKYTNRLFKELNQITSENYSLTEKSKKRIRFYTSQACISASWACALRGSGLSKEEKRNVIYLGAITPILDDLTDITKATSSQILDFLDDNGDEENQEKVIARYLHKQLQEMKNEYFNVVFTEALIAQDTSIKQIEERVLSEEELTQIALDKGGRWTLCYRSSLAPAIKPGEREAFFTLGYIAQQINDMFDIYKDYRNKQQTLFTNSKDINNNYLDFQSKIQQMISQFYQLDYDKKNITKCLAEISAITSRGMVCIHQLLSLQNKNSEFDITKFSRQQLVCDMEKLSNVLKSLMYSFRFYDQLKAAR